MAESLTIRDVSFAYGPLSVIEGFSLDVSEGEFVALVGPSGTGKTSLLRMLAGIVQPDSGTISIEGKSVLSPSRRCLLVDQRLTLFPWMSCLDHIKFSLSRPLDPNWRVAASKALEEVGLSGFEMSYPAQLSGGMKQRLALGRAIAARPSVLLLDEPFSALDIFSRQGISDLICSLLSKQAVRSIVLVSHDIRDAVYCADRVIVLGPRPASIISETPIPFLRPRSHDIKTTMEFRALQAQIEDKLLEQGVTL